MRLGRPPGRGASEMQSAPWLWTKAHIDRRTGEPRKGQLWPFSQTASWQTSRGFKMWRATEWSTACHRHRLNTVQHILVWSGLWTPALLTRALAVYFYCSINALVTPLFMRTLSPFQYFAQSRVLFLRWWLVLPCCYCSSKKYKLSATSVVKITFVQLSQVKRSD